MRRRVIKQVSDDAFASYAEPKHHVTNPKIKAAPKAPPKSSQKPESIRMQVSFVLPEGMTRGTAVNFVLTAINDAANAAELPNIEQLQIIPFKAGFKL